MAGLVIEQIGRGGGQTIFHKAAALPLRIGRAPDNDIILADPYVSPSHVAIDESDSGWIVTDCGSTNGVFIGKGTRISGPVELHSGDYLQIGRTVFRLLSPVHAVPHALPFKPRRSLAVKIIIPVLAILSLCAMFAFITMDRFFDTVTETKLEAVFAEALPFLFFPLMWAGIWALAGFIAKRRGDFSMQLLTANVSFILFFLIVALAEWVDYWTSSVRISDLIRYTGIGLLSISLLFVNLKIATGIADIRRAVIALSIGGGIIAVIAVSDHAQSAQNDILPVYSRTLKPPYVSFSRALTVDQFFSHNERLFRSGKTGK
jgi:hypothetical protein